MSNSTTGKIWKVDGPGLLIDHHDGPVRIKHIVFMSHDTEDSFKLTYYDVETEIEADETFSETYTGEISSTDDLTLSGGSLISSTVVDGSVFEIVRSSGLAANVNVPALVKTAGDDTTVVVWDDPWTDESSVAGYSWKVYTSYDFIYAEGLSNHTYHFPFDNAAGGYKVPNLSCESLTSGSFVYIYT